MVLQRLFRPRPALQTGAALYEAATRQARLPAFYADLRVPDTIEGRFELYTLHVILLVCRLKGEGAEAAEISQALFDSYLRSLDDALRDMGVGDLSVGKKMRKLGQAFYGRAKAYDAALAADSDELQALIAQLATSPWVRRCASWARPFMAGPRPTTRRWRPIRMSCRP